ncbi:sucrose transporter [Thozetella sp. PMI_491]|nr:sucrose transporter [Thozetella sp. PMI_491]
MESSAYSHVKLTTMAGRSFVKGNSEAIRMALLTFNSIGMAFMMGIEMTYFTPYLLSLGLSKSQTALVWLAGPLSGLIVQPIIGALSDSLTSRWGRRRPIILTGAILASCSLLMLGFTKDIVGVVIRDEDTAKIPTIVFAVLALYMADFSVNAMMSCSRSLIADTLTADKQHIAAAWSNRMSSVGQIGGYAIGTLDLVKIFGTGLGDTQFKKLALIASLGMLLTASVTCWAVTEHVFVSAPSGSPKLGRFRVFRQIWTTLRNLPPRIQALCWAVFWSMIGWFPFLFYNSTWIGELYYRYEVPDEARDSKDALGDMSRIGSMALTIHSLVSFAGAWLLPLFIKNPEDRQRDGRKPDLLTAWIAGSILFAAAMSLAPFVTSFRFATALIAICGLPLNVTMWAPMTFLGIEVNKLGNGSSSAQGEYHRLSTDSAVEMGDISFPLSRPEDEMTASHQDEGDGGKLSGIYFGIFNIYMTLPQLIGTMISSVVFAVLEPKKDGGMTNPENMVNQSKRHGMEMDMGQSGSNAVKGPNAIAVCLFIGAMSSLVAAYAARRLKFIS